MRITPLYIIDYKDIGTRILYKILHTVQYYLQEFNIQKAPDDDDHHHDTDDAR